MMAVCLVGAATHLAQLTAGAIPVSAPIMVPGTSRQPVACIQCER
jgi:hypothetical protein